MAFGYDAALSALTAARTALQTIGHNLSNANTVGYSRQRVLMSPLLPQSFGRGMYIGNGVGIDAIDQVYDPLITGRLRSQAHEVGRAGGQIDVYRDLESAWGEPSENGLNARLSAFFSALGALQTAPADGALRTAAVQSAVSLAQSFRTIRADLGAVSNSVDSAIEYEATKVNKKLEELYELNRSIVRNGFASNLPPDVKDQQNQLLAELSQSIDVRVVTDTTGQISVISNGQMLVNPNGMNRINVIPRQITGEGVRLRAASSTVDFKPKNGKLSALVELAPKIATEGTEAFDELARNLIREINHAHATGVPTGGGYTSLVATHAFIDADFDGDILGEKLADVGLPFEMKDGYLTVSVRDDAGNTTQTRIAVVPESRTVNQLIADLNLVPHLNASLDPTGKLRLTSDAGYKFDFSNRLNPTPDLAGTFSGEKATLVAALPFPTPIPPGLQFQLSVDGGPPQTITFLASHFANPNAATPEEMAAAINSQVFGAHASVSANRLVIQSATVGSSGSLQLNGGNVVTGVDQPVQVKVAGAYKGSVDQTFLLTPNMDGVIGQTPGLKIEIRQNDGTLLGSLDVGLGYTPDTPLQVVDGIEISFSAGPVSKTADRFLTIDAIAESDPTDLLVATGMNALFDGYDASTIQVRSDLADDPSLLGAGLGGGESDGSNLARLIGVGSRKLSSLGERTVGGYFDSLVQETGTGTNRAQATYETQQLMMEQLEARRQSVSGVNIDEELLLMENFQRSFEVAARFTQTLSAVNDVLMNLTR
jgi:flagellar hook-associated protein FlgK